MDIQYNKIESFKIKIYQSAINFEEECKFYNEKIKYYNMDDYLTIEENRETEILFECKNVDARLYMDGIETIQENIINEDNDGNVYICPSEKKIILYNTNNFPLIPGFFRIIVQIDNIKYFSKIKVKPKLVTESGLEIIKDDLEDEINGLAFELIKKNIAFGENDMKNLPIKLYKFLIIKNSFSKIMFALQDIKIKPNYKIAKKYKIIKKDELKSIDEVTMKSYLEGNIEEDFLKEPIIELDYNLSENQWLKKIIKDIGQYLEEFIEVSNNFIKKKNTEIEEIKRYGNSVNNKNRLKDEERSIGYLNSLIELAFKMKNSINMLKEIEWFKNVSPKISINLSHTLFYDNRYNCIYKLYRELKDNDFSVRLDNKYSFQWKRTDKLYEMWCFVKIARIIASENIGFNIHNGWLFDQEINLNKILVPELQPETKISFKKEEIFLNFRYDQKIPYYSDHTFIDNSPIYITRINNRPDGRIDIYIRDIYIGSIILEFKYRDRKDLWYKNYTQCQNRSNESNVIKQLTAYGDNCKSLYVFKGKSDKNYNKDFQPIRKVLIFYPKRTCGIEEIDEVEDHNLKFIRFSPTGPSNSAEESIKLSIEELIERSREYINKN